MDSKADVNSIGISLSDNKPRSNDTGLSNGTSSIFQFSILDFIDSVSQILIFGTIIGLMNSPNQSNNDQQITLKDILAGIPPSIVHFIIEGLDTSCPYLIKNSIEVMINKNLESIMQNFANRTIDFIFNQIYPMFLQIYDQTVKKDLGIVYTPSEVVNFMVSAVDFLLKSKFNIDNGIIGQSIHYYDPSVGTFAFPIGFLNIAHKQYFDPKSQDSINSINREDFSSWFNSTFLQDDKRINSFKVIDIQFVSLALGELRIKMRARELGIEIEKTGTFNILLCNPMEDGNIFFDTKTQSAKITKNNNNADNKATNNNNQFNNTTRVIITNPPYNVSSKNNSKWITRLMKDYTDPESLPRTGQAHR